MTGIPERRPPEGEHLDQKQATGHFEVTYWVCGGGILSEGIPCKKEKIGRQKVGYGMVVDGFAKFQALNFGISGPGISERFSFESAKQGIYWKCQALKSKFQGLKFGDSIHHHSIPHLSPLKRGIQTNKQRKEKIRALSSKGRP